MQNKYLNDFELLERVRQAVLRRKCSVTVGDIIAETGLNHDDARSALTALMATHEGTMHVSDKGELVYVFTTGCTLRDERSWWERNKATVFKFVKLAFKVAMAAVLVVYFAIYLVIVAIFFARIWNKDKDDSSDTSGLDLSFTGIIWFFWGTTSSQSYEARWNGEKKMPIYERFYQFVFGPDREAEDPLADRTRCAQLIRAKKGIITAQEWLMVTGKSLKDCENDLARFTAEFNGTVEILDNGTLCYCFEDLMMSSKNESGQTTAEQPPEGAWKNLDTPLSLCGTEYKLVLGFNTFNLIMALIFIAAGPNLTAFIIELMTFQYGQTGSVSAAPYQDVTLWLGSIPFVFSLIVFLAPLLRLPGNRRENKTLRDLAVRKAVLSSVFAPSTAAPRFTLKQAFQTVATCFKRANLAAPQMEEVSRELNEIGRELDAERDLEDYAYFNFRSLYQSFQDVEAERHKRGLDSQAVRVAFSTDSDEQGDIEHSDAVREFDEALGVASQQPPKSAENKADVPETQAVTAPAVPPKTASDRALLAFNAEESEAVVPNFLDGLKDISDDEYDRMYATAPSAEKADGEDTSNILAGLKDIPEAEYEHMYDSPSQESERADNA